MVQGADKNPLRSLLYLSDLKLGQIFDSIDERTRRSIATQLTIDIKLLSVTLSSSSPDRSLRNRSRVARLTVGEQYLRQRRQIGDVASGDTWIEGQADMGWKPLQDGKTVLFCGYAGPLLVVLGGSVSNVLGYPASDEQTGSYTATIREAVSGGGQPEQFWHDLAATARDICVMPQPVRFLARVLSREYPNGAPARPAIVLATPLYVELADESLTGQSATASRVTRTAAPALSASTPPESPPAATSGEPQSIGPYMVQRRLGEGSMGVVYQVKDRDGRDLALKVIRHEYAQDAAFLRRLADEANTARRVQDPSVARLVDAVVNTETPYLVTEFAEGPTLLDKVSRDGPLPIGEAVEVGIGTANALAAIHAADIIHRDLAPSNVILSRNGPRVIDFGVASSAVSGEGPKGDRLRVGTPAYMSPEQIQREELTPASDVFSWASTMVFAATGHQPFGRTSRLGTFWEIQEDEPDLTDLPAELREIISAALDKNPAARPPADELVRGLRAIARPEPPSGQEHPSRLKRITKSWVSWATFAAIVVLGITTSVTLLPSNSALTMGQSVSVTSEQTGGIGAAIVTLSDGQVTTQPIGRQAPANGYYVVVHVKVTATADGFNLNSSAFYAVVNGRHYDTNSGNEPTLSLPNELNFGTGIINKGQSSSGDIAFDIPAQHGTVAFTPGNANTPVAYWSF